MTRRKQNDDDAISYGCPPTHSRFKPGCSGNPAGRPKAATTFDEALRRRLLVHVPVTENGKRKKITILEAIIGRLAQAAAGGDLRATSLLLKLVASRSSSAGADGAAVPADLADLERILNAMGGDYAGLLGAAGGGDVDQD